MKVFLIILLLVVALICLLIFASIRLKVYLSKDGYLTVRYLFLRFRFEIYGDGKLKIKKSDKPKGKKLVKKSKKTEKPGFIKRLYKEKGAVEGTVELLSLVKLLLSKMALLFSKSEISKLELDIKITGDDPSSVAIFYGAVSSFVYPAVGLINGIFKVKKQHINLFADYESKHSEVRFYAYIKVKIISVIWVVISFIKDYIKNYIK